MSMVLGLYQSILVPICSDWLQVQELGSLDAAMCNARMRQYFSTVLQLSKVTDVNVEMYNREIFYEWIYSRKILLNRLFLDEKSCKNPSPAIKFILSSKILSELEFGYCEKVHESIQSCVGIKKLRISCGNESFVLPAIEKFGPTLEELELEMFLASFSKKFGSTIAQYCPLLRSCKARNLDLLPVLAACPIKSIEHFPLHRVFVKAARQDCLPDWLDNYGSKISLLASDDSTLVIGERSYQISELKFYYDTIDTVELLTQYLGHVSKVELFGEWNVLTSVLERCESLTSLYLSTNVKSDLIIRALSGHFPFLKRLHISVQHHESIMIQAAMNRPLLEEFRVDINGARIVDSVEMMSVFFQLSDGCPRLKWVELPHRLPETFLSHQVTGLDSLKLTRDPQKYSSFHRESYDLKFSTHDSLSHKYFLKVFQQNPRLVRVTFDRQAKFNDGIMGALVSMCPLLKQVCVIKCKSITYTGLLSLKECKFLNMLHFEPRNCELEINLDCLLQDMVTLEHLSFHHYTGLPASDLQSISRHCPNITNIDLSFCNQLQDSDVISLLIGCTKLVSFNLTGCSHITTKIMPALTSQHIRVLNLRGTTIKEKFALRNNKCKIEVGRAVSKVSDEPQPEDDD